MSFRIVVIAGLSIALIGAEEQAPLDSPVVEEVDTAVSSGNDSIPPAEAPPSSADVRPAVLSPMDTLVAILARPDLDQSALGDVRHAIDMVSPELRPMAIRSLGAAGKRAVAPEVARYLTAIEPDVVVAAIEAIGHLWPTASEDAVAVRACIGHHDLSVAAAAMSFALQVNDDRAVPVLARRLQENPAEGWVREALRRFSGSDLADGEAWLQWYADQEAEAGPTLAELGKDIAAPDPETASRAVQQAIGLRKVRSAVAELLITAADHSSARVRKQARAGLRQVGGPVADCWSPDSLSEEEDVEEVTGPIVTAPMAVATPMKPPGSSDLLAIVIFTSLLAVLAVVVMSLRRRPPAPAAQVNVVSTRIIRRQQQMKWLR